MIIRTILDMMSTTDKDLLAIMRTFEEEGARYRCPIVERKETRVVSSDGMANSRISEPIWSVKTKGKLISRDSSAKICQSSHTL